jgi:hypothetical protein
MRKNPLVIALIVALAITVPVLYINRSASTVLSYDPFINLILDPESVNPYSAHTLQLKSFGFLSPTPEPRPVGTALVDCGPSGDPAHPYDVPGEENKILAAYSPAYPAVAGPGDRLALWYRDEHAMALGVSKVETNNPLEPIKTFDIVPYTGGKSSSIETIQNEVLKFGAPYQYVDPVSGLRDPTFDAIDTSGRPIHPALFITDITVDPNSTAGDWENGGIPIAPHHVYGQWKVLIKYVSSDGSFQYDQDNTLSGTNDDPPGNYDESTNTGDLGVGGDPIPEGVALQRHGSHVGEAVWEVNRLVAAGLMQSGRTYRVQFMAHDGDQSKEGGDVGEACGTVRT